RGPDHGRLLRPPPELAGRSHASGQDAVLRSRSGGPATGREDVRGAAVRAPDPAPGGDDPFLRGSEAGPDLLPPRARLLPSRAGGADLAVEPPEHRGVPAGDSAAAPALGAFRDAGAQAGSGAARPLPVPGPGL